MRAQRIARLAAPFAAVIGVALGGWGLTDSAVAAPKTADGPGIARRALAGDAAAGADLETAVEPLFDRKDLLTLDEPSGSREAARLIGLPDSTVHWYVLPGSVGLRVLTVDLGAAASTPSAGGSGYVAYGIVEAGSGSAAKVSWYHDAGRKLAEQGGRAWHPVAVRSLAAGGSEERALAVEAATEAGSSDARGVLLLEQKGGEWTATRRLAPAGDARLIGVGTRGAVFVAAREPPKGVLSGAPSSLFRSLVFYERTAAGFAPEPAAAPLTDVVTATEAVLAALRRGDKDEARRLCASQDVIDQMLYFSPGWKGGGRVVQATPTTLEVAYEEIERPALRLTFTYQNRGGALLLVSVTGRAEKDVKKG